MIAIDNSINVSKDSGRYIPQTGDVIRGDDDTNYTMPPFIYYQAGAPVELITTGLLLGYPLESTASIL